MTVFVLGPSGVAEKIDIPTDPHIAERFHASIASGQFRIVDESDVEETTTRHGGVIYVLKTAGDDSAKPTPRKKAARKKAASKKAAEQVTPQADTDGTPEADAEEDAPDVDADESPAGDEPTD